MTNLPPIPTGDSPLVRWCRAVHERVFQRLRIVDSPDIVAQETTRGISLKIKAPPSAAQSVSTEIMIFCIVGLDGSDVMTCRTWDGTNLGATDVSVAKQLGIRGVDGETIDGVALAYTYPVGDDTNNNAKMKDNFRTAGDGANTESQIAYRRYQALAPELVVAIPPDPSVITPSMTVLACKPSNGTLTAAPWIEIGPARIWARTYVQPYP